MYRLVRRPTVLTLIGGLCIFSILALRGLDIGPLQTDVIIVRAWFRETGFSGFSKRFFDVNQRHLLAGPLIGLALQVFGENDLPYQVIFQLSRVSEGVFLAGVVYQLTRRRALAVCAGLALTLTMLRLAELYQEVSWFIEPTLAMLLASSYWYLLSIKHPRYRSVLYITSILLYVGSILIYESGIPWIAVNLFIGYVGQEGLPARRIWQTVRAQFPALLCALLLTVLVTRVFGAWEGLAPDAQAASPGRIASQFGSALNFPAVYLERVQVALNDGYGGLLISAALIAAAGALGCHFLAGSRIGFRSPRSVRWRTLALLVVLALLMIFAAVLVGTSNQIGKEYLDRITFGRSAGIALLYVTLIFGLCRAFRWRDAIATSIVALTLLGPGAAATMIYQNYAQRSRAEIERLTTAVITVRQTLYLPVHLVILTDPNWVLARYTDASDVILHEVQFRLYQRNEPATIDFLKQGGYEENYATLPGSCQTVNGQASAGMCLGIDHLYGNRWTQGGPYPYADVVIVHWNAQAGRLDVLPELTLANLNGYNITTANLLNLKTNKDRVAVPIPGLTNP